MSKLVCLDPGHDENNVNRSPCRTYYEWEFAQDVCDKAEAIIKGIPGLDCIKTKQKNDTGINLQKRVRVANNAKADLFLSQHTNAFGSGGWTSPNGFEIYRFPGRNLSLARVGLKWSEELLDMNNRGIKQANFYVTNPTYINCPSILFETGFHTNRDDVRKLKTQAFRMQQAIVLVRTACEFLKVNFPEKEDDLRVATKSHMVERGENLSRIASDYKMSLDALKKINPQIDDANKIEVDELVFLKKPQPAEIVYARHIRSILHGDTQYGLQLEKTQAELQEEKTRTAAAIAKYNEYQAGVQKIYNISYDLISS